jgi:transcriptional regulator with XRE-family HTH domain
VSFLNNPAYERIKSLIKLKNTTAKQVLSDLGLNAGFFADRNHKGRTAFSSDTIVKFAEYFDVSIDYLLGTPQKKEPLREDEVVQRINQALVDKGWKLPDGRMSDIQLNTLIGFISDNAETLRKIVEQDS